MQYYAPALSSAVVPITDDAVFDALTLTYLGSTSHFSKSYNTVIKFIILVKLAIYLRL